MRTRLTALGTVIALFGVLFLIGGGIAFTQIQDGYDSLQAFSEAQNVTLNYNEDGQLVDRGSVEEAEAIMAIVTDDWAYPIDQSDFDPNDPLVNSDSEYMFQMATIIHHTTSGTATVVLDEPALDEDGNVLYEAGTYEVPLEGRYWTEFDRTDPLDGPARAQAWSGTVHGLVGELGVGTVTHSALQMGLGIAAILGGVGGVLLVAGLGMVWVARATEEQGTLFFHSSEREATTV